MSSQGQSLDMPRLDLLINTSPLIFGTDQFLATLLMRMSNLVSGTVEGISRPEQVISLIQSRQPDILLLQANLEDSLAICSQIKENSQLGGIYCIFVEELLQPISERDLTLMIAALESGADGYLQLALTTTNSLVAEQEDRLLRAKIQVALRWVNSYRELMQTNNILSSIALADPLTGLSNRRALEWELPRQIQNARVQSTPLSLIMLDVDYFKSVNDNYGHLVGDRILKLLSARLQHHLRVHDTVFRYGGEEFTIILRNTSSTLARPIADRVRHLICDQPFRIDDTLSLNITVSLGIAYLKPIDDPKGMSLLNRADQNLLQAKNYGRNRVVSEEI